MLGATRQGTALSAFAAEGALDGRLSFIICFHHAERAGCDAGAAAVAYILLNLDRSICLPIDSIYRAGRQTCGLIAVLA